MRLRLETRLVHGNQDADEPTGSISFPIYQSATFKHPGPNQSTGFDYSRSENPTRDQIEKTIADLENGKAGFAFSSGMAAISAVLELFLPGDHLIVSDDLYGGTYRLFEEIYRNHGLEFAFVDTCDIDKVRKNIKPNTRAFFIETPSNPMMKVTDISALVSIAKLNNITVIVDNTFLSPYFQRPLDLGADIVVHSGTKYLGGHNDTLAGFLILNDPGQADKIREVQKSVGAVLAPFDSWLIWRGIKTLGIRLEKQQSNAIKIADWLKANRLVEKVYYVGLPEHEEYAISKKQSSGFGAMISFTVKDVALVEKILSRTKIISFAESLGGVESLITYPAVQTHASIPAKIRDKIGINERLLRLSVGIEAVEDIINDLDQAMS